MSFFRNDVKSIVEKDAKKKGDVVNYFTTITFEDEEVITYHSFYVEHFGVSHTIKDFDGIVWIKDGTLRDFVPGQGWKPIRKLTERELDGYMYVKNKYNDTNLY